MAEDETVAATPAEPVEAPTEPPTESAAPAEPQAEPQAVETTTDAPPAPSAEADAAETTETAAFIETVRQRLASANYGVSAGVDITLVERGDHRLLLFTAKDAQEALRAASAALASVPDDDAVGRGWRFMGGGPDLETGRYRAVVRVAPAAAPASDSAESAVE